MPPSKDNNSKPNYTRTYSNNGTTLQAKVWHQATNLMPASPPQSPTGMAPSYGSSKGSSTSTWGRQNSQNGKYS